MKPGAIDGRKMRDLAAKLRAMVPPPSYAAQAIGHMEALWAWAWAKTDDGDLSGFEPQDIAGAAKWRGDADQFVALLLDAGYLDKVRGRLVLHDAEDHRPDYVRKRIQERGRASGRKTSGGSSGKLPADLPEATPENPRRIRATFSPPSASASASGSDPAFASAPLASLADGDAVECDARSENPGEGCELPPMAPLDDPEEPLADVDALPVGDPWREVLTACRDIRAGHGRVLLASDQAAIKGMREVAGAGLRHEIPAAFEAFNASEDDFLKRNGWPVRVFASQFSRWHAVAVAGRGGGPRRPRITSNGDGATEVHFD